MGRWTVTSWEAAGQANRAAQAEQQQLTKVLGREDANGHFSLETKGVQWSTQ
jgi:hypothetical protein